MCRFVNHPNYTLDIEPTQTISLDQHCELVRLIDEAEIETPFSRDVEKLAVSV